MISFPVACALVLLPFVAFGPLARRLSVAWVRFALWLDEDPAKEREAQRDR